MISDLLVPHRHGILFAALDHVENGYSVLGQQAAHRLRYAATSKVSRLLEVGQTILSGIFGCFDDQDILDTLELRPQDALETIDVHGLVSIREYVTLCSLSSSVSSESSVKAPEATNPARNPPMADARANRPASRPKKNPSMNLTG